MPLIYYIFANMGINIVDFSFENYRSFKEMNALNMTAAKIKSKNTEIDETNVFEINKDKLLKTKVIYGANASGKSNAISALSDFFMIVAEDAANSQKNFLNMLEPFHLASETENKPTFFQLIFILDEVKYRYGFEADKKKVHSEWLYATPKEREVTLFIRNNNSYTNISKKHFNELNKTIKLIGNEKEIVNEQTLLLPTLSSFGFTKLSKKIIDGFKSIHLQSFNKQFSQAVKMLNINYKEAVDLLATAIEEAKEGSSANLNEVLSLLNFTDRDIKDIEIRKLGGENFIKVIKDQYNKKGQQTNSVSIDFLYTASEGTLRFFTLFSSILGALKTGSVLLLDEIDRSLHPLLSKKIIELFNSKHNKNNAQLIFTTHDTNLLSHNLMRRDQIDFVEKDKFGASHLYSLVNFKGVRNTDSFEKDYLQGKYGAIPFLGNFAETFNLD